MASSDTTCPIDTWGSKNWASDGGDHDVGVGHPVEGAAGADPVDGGDHRLGHALVPGREVDVPVLHRPAVALHAHAVGGDLADVHPGLERPPVARVDDDPHLGVGLQLQPGDGQLVAHGEVHGVELVGPIEDQPAHRALPLDDQRRVVGVAPGRGGLGLSLTMRSSGRGRLGRGSPGPGPDVGGQRLPRGGGPAIREGGGSLGLVGVAPHGDEVDGARPAGVGEAQLQGAPTGPAC